MVRQVVIPLIEAKVEHNAAACGLVLVLAVKAGRCTAALEQFAVGAHTILVAHDRVELEVFATCQGQAIGDGQTRNQARVDPLDVGVGVVLDAEFRAQFYQRLRHGASSAHGM